MNFLKKIFPVIVIILFWLALVVTNYSPDTWLSGWDNLHPEFNFGLNIGRSIHSAWQEYQGLGLLGGMGHAADLFRQIFLWILSFIFPAFFLRYFFHFLMLLVGALGVYFLVKKLADKKGAALAGAIFYLFNLATLQMFYVPFEPYSVHFGFLPWLFLVLINFIRERSRRNAAIFLLVNLLASAQGYVATFFIVYFFALMLFGMVYFFQSKNSWKRILLAGLLIFSVNSFWLLPNIYFAVQNVNVNLDSKINLMATSDNFLRNKKYGDLADATLLKGFWFDNVEINKEGVQDYVMEDWVGYMQKPIVKVLGYFLFGLCMAGIIFALIKKQKNVWLFLPVFFISFTFLANDTFGFSFLAGLLYKLPLFSQIFRFPFTKFAIVTALCLAIFFGYFVSFVFSSLKRKFVQIMVMLVLLFLPIIYLLPVFKGKLFYSKEQVKIPPEYFQVFDYFKKQDKKTRIANFPQSTFWGWTFYKWNYSGSGFLWYGIEQPILDRAFDVWSNYNENYYWEISNAVFSKNEELFFKILGKYQVNWILFDENIINGGEYRSLGIDELEEILSDRSRYQLVKSFGKIKIYKVALQTPVKDFVFVEDLKEIGPVYKWNNFDKAFVDNGNYVTSTEHRVQSTKWNVYFPFRSLFTGRKTDELEFTIENLGDSFVFRKELPAEIVGGDVLVPFYEPDELLFVDPNDLSNRKYFLPEVNFAGNFIEVKFPKIWGYFSADIDPTGRKESLDKTESTAFYLPHLPHDLSYLISVQSKNIEGKNLLFWLENLNLRRPDMEVYLEGQGTKYLIQPPMEKDGVGYSLHFDNISIGREKTVNELGKVTVNLIPYKFLTSIKLVDSLSDLNDIYHLSGMKRILVYSQAYDQGWKAYESSTKYKVQSTKWRNLLALVFGKELKDHVLVNNWENGWVIDESVNPDNVVFVYFPQYLEYLGFLLMGVGFIVILLFCPSNRRQDLQNI